MPKRQILCQNKLLDIFRKCSGERMSDNGPFNVKKGLYIRRSGRHSAAVLQFFSRRDPQDLNSLKRDKLYLMLIGTDTLFFDHTKFSMEDCFERVAIGVVNTATVGENDEGARCAAWDKDLGW